MMCLKGIQRPIGIGHHSNPSLSADQNGHFRRSVAGTHCVFRRIEDLNGVVDEPAHKSLIGTVEWSLNVFYLGRRTLTLQGGMRILLFSGNGGVGKTSVAAARLDLIRQYLQRLSNR